MESACAIRWHQWWTKKKTATKKNCETEVKIEWKTPKLRFGINSSCIIAASKTSGRNCPCCQRQRCKFRGWQPTEYEHGWCWEFGEFLRPPHYWRNRISLNRLLSKPITFFHVHHSSGLKRKRKFVARTCEHFLWMISRFWRMQMSCGNARW